MTGMKVSFMIVSTSTQMPKYPPPFSARVTNTQPTPQATQGRQGYGTTITTRYLLQPLPEDYDASSPNCPSH